VNEDGFPNGARLTPVPDLFFSEYLQDRLSPLALKVFLHLLWRIHRRPVGHPPAARVSGLAADETLRRGLAQSEDPDAGSALGGALTELEDASLVLTVKSPGDEGPDTWLFVNSEEGRRELERWHEKGSVLTDEPMLAARGSLDRATVFALYEENIGMLTPMMAEELAGAQEKYPDDWLADAFKIAVEHNARSWAYVKGVLERWGRDGREDEADRRGAQAARERDIEGPYSSYVEH
jgi:DnaD/phage-associated family protein